MNVLSTQIAESTHILRDYVSDPRNTTRHDDMTKVVLCIIRRKTIPENSCKKSTSYSLLISAGIISAGAKVFFVPINMKLPIGPAFAAGNLASFFVLELWAARGLINDLMGENSTSHLKILQKDQPHIWKRAIVGADSIAIGCFSQLPSAYAAAYYNPSSLKLIAGIVTLISGAFFPSRSVYLSQMNILKRDKLEGPQRKIFEYQLKLVEFIKNYREYFLHLDEKEKNMQIEDIGEIRAIDNDKRAISTFFKKCTKITPITQSSPSKLRQTGEKIVDSVSGVLTVTFPTALGLYTYSLSRVYILDNQWFAVATGLITAGSFSYYSGKAFFHTSRRIYHSAINTLTGKRQKSLAEQIRPKTLFCMQAIGLVTNAFALGASVVIWGDYFEDYPGIKEYFQTTICTSIFLLVFTAMLDTVDDIVSTVISTYDHDLKSEWVKLDSELEVLQKTIEACPPEKFMPFITEEMRTYFLDRIDSARSEIV